MQYTHIIVDDYYSWLLKDTTTFQKGMVKGREEEKLKIAKEMLKNNIDINLISQITGIPEQEVQKLKDCFLSKLGKYQEAIEACGEAIKIIYLP